MEAGLIVSMRFPLITEMEMAARRGYQGWRAESGALGTYGRQLGEHHHQQIQLCTFQNYRLGQLHPSTAGSLVVCREQSEEGRCSKKCPNCNPTPILHPRGSRSLPIVNDEGGNFFC